MVAGAAGQSLFQPVEQEPPVGQIGERVVESQAYDLVDLLTTIERVLNE